jgi:hypothetical protein
LLVFGTIALAEDISLAEIGRINKFAMVGTGFAGDPVSGMHTFQKIVKRKDALEQFIKLYVRGNNEAKAYAVVGFYYLDPILYEHIKSIYGDSTLWLRTVEGCDDSGEPLSTFFERVERGAYDGCVPAEKDKRKAEQEDRAGR